MPELNQCLDEWGGFDVTKIVLAQKYRPPIRKHRASGQKGVARLGNEISTYPTVPP